MDYTIIIQQIKYFLPIRILAKPVVNILRMMNKYLYSKTEYSNRLRSLKNIYKGEKCFIIGNGPSLKVEDLDRIKNYYCFSANQIYQIFDKTEWRPTFYTMMDKDGISKHKELRLIGSEYNFYNSRAIKKKNSDNPNVFFFFNDSYFNLIKGSSCHPYIGNDVSKSVSDCGTVTFTNIQLAIYMGFSYIYLGVSTTGLNVVNSCHHSGFIKRFPYTSLPLPIKNIS